MILSIAPKIQFFRRNEKIVSELSRHSFILMAVPQTNLDLSWWNDRGARGHALQYGFTYGVQTIAQEKRNQFEFCDSEKVGCSDLPCPLRQSLTFLLTAH